MAVKDRVFRDEMLGLGSRNWREIPLEGLGVVGAESVSIVRINSKISDRTEHTHPGLVELIYCLRGEWLKCSRNGTLDTLRPGEIFVAFPGERHCVLDGPKGRFTYALQFRLPTRARGFSGLSPEEFCLFVNRLRKARRMFAVPSSVASCFQTVLRLCDDRKMRDAERTIRIRHALDAILIAVCDAAVKGVRATKTRSSGIEAIISDMRNLPFADYPLDDLCARLDLSKPGLIARFKSLTGSTPHAFLLRCRIEASEKLLKARRDVASVAQELGFSSPQHFAKVFREMTGVPPSRWKGT